MNTGHYIEQLTQSGLTQDQATIYETLLRTGPLSAREIALKTGVPRTLGYAVLEQLIAAGLVQKDESTKVARFVPLHPSHLHELIEANRRKAEHATVSLKTVLPDLASLYNLATGRPGIRFYEGEEGVKEALFDTLTSKESIYTYADMETVDGYAGDINESYVRARLKAKVPKKILMPDTPAARAEIQQHENDELTEVRLIKNQDAPPFHAAMQIYDGKVSYSTFTKDILMATIISDQAIYSLHRFLFEEAWRSALKREDIVRA